MSTPATTAWLSWPPRCAAASPARRVLPARRCRPGLRFAPEQPGADRRHTRPPPRRPHDVVLPGHSVRYLRGMRLVLEDTMTNAWPAPVRGGFNARQDPLTLCPTLKAFSAFVMLISNGHKRSLRVLVKKRLDIFSLGRDIDSDASNSECELACFNSRPTIWRSS